MLIRVVHKRPGMPAEVVTIDNDFRELKKLIDNATLCAFRLNREVHGYCDDEGLRKDLLTNIVLSNGNTIAGPIVLSRRNGEGDDIGFDEAGALALCAKLNE